MSKKELTEEEKKISEAKRRYAKKWREKNPDYAKNYQRKRYHANPEISKEYQKKWREQNPDKVKIYQRKFWLKQAELQQTEEKSQKEN